MMPHPANSIRATAREMRRENYIREKRMEYENVSDNRLRAVVRLYERKGFVCRVLDALEPESREYEDYHLAKKMLKERANN